jgi:hypothetical protein
MNDASVILSRIMMENADWAERLKKKIADVRQDKIGILSAAEQYAKEHAQEIAEGTRQKQLLLAEGASQGLTEEEVMSRYGKFLPSVRTPILNMLYFMLRESHDPGMEAIRKEFDSKYGNLTHSGQFDESSVKEPEHFDKFLYGSFDHDTFKKIKKLKALSRSQNEHESFLAYRMCLKLCEKYGLNMDSIPCDITSMED